MHLSGCLVPVVVAEAVGTTVAMAVAAAVAPVGVSPEHCVAHDETHSTSASRYLSPDREVHLICLSGDLGFLFL